MFWTDFLKGLIKVFITIAIIIIFIIGVKIASINDDMAIVGLLVIAIGVILVLTFVSIIGVFTEISDNLYELNQNTRGLNNKAINTSTATNDTPKANYSTVTTNNPPQNIQKINNLKSTNWECPECDTINPLSTRTCKGCGYQK